MNEYLKKSLLILNIEKNDMNTLFFSDNNLKYIQQQINLKVKQKTNYVISEQNCTDILQAMQYFYVNNPMLTIDTNNITDNINQLNELVINDLLKSIISNMNQYIYYRKNYNKFKFMEYGLSSNTKGNNSLEFNHHILN